MDYAFFNTLPVLIAATVIIIVFFLGLRLPPILGYLTVGVLASSNIATFKAWSYGVTVVSPGNN